MPFRLSELPPVFLCCILSYLPRSEAARTVVLSRYWAFVWDLFRRELGLREVVDGVDVALSPSFLDMPTKDVYLTPQEIDNIINLRHLTDYQKEEYLYRQKLDDFEVFYNIRSQGDLHDFLTEFNTNKIRFNLEHSVTLPYVENPYRGTKEVEPLASFAVSEYKKDKVAIPGHKMEKLILGTILRFFSFQYENAVHLHRRWTTYYITFFARDRNETVKLYHAAVLDVPDFGFILNDFRLSRSSGQTSVVVKSSPWDNELVVDALRFEKRFAVLAVAPEERARYYEEVKASKGFDITSKFGRYLLGGITQRYPLTGLRAEGLRARLIEIAYFVATEKKLNNLVITKVNYQLVAGMNYYMTFVAKDSNGLQGCYRALVYVDNADKMRLDLFEEKVSGS